MVILRYVIKKECIPEERHGFLFFRHAAKTEERNLLLILPQITFGEAQEN